METVMNKQTNLQKALNLYLFSLIFLMSLLADPLESEDFDPVSYINERFPTGIVKVLPTNCLSVELFW